MKRAVLVAILVLMTFVGLSCGNNAPELQKQQHANDLADIKTVLMPFMEQYKAQFDKQNEQNTKLSGDNAKLQSELSQAKAALSDAQKATGVAQAKATSLENQGKELNAEIANLNSALLNSVNDKSTFEKRFYQSQEVVSQLQTALNVKQSSYDTLYAKLTKVNTKNDPIVLDYTVAERTAFYIMWDRWWNIVVLGN